MTIEEHLRLLQLRLRVLLTGVFVFVVAIRGARWFPEPYGALVPQWVLLALLLGCLVPAVLILRKLRCPRCSNSFGWWDGVPHVCPKCQLDFTQPDTGPIGASPFK